MSLTDDIYQELIDALERGLDCGEVMAKHTGSKGPAYNALGRAIRDASAQMTVIAEKRKQIEKEVYDAEQKQDLLRHEAEEAESNLSKLADEKDAREKQLQDLETRISEKTEFLAELREVERLGFGGDSLRQLRDALTEIGAKCGLRSKEAVTRFFEHLRDYGGVLQAEAELEALRKQIEARRLETEGWQAKKEALRTKHDELRDVISAMRSLRSRRIKSEQLVAWNQVLSVFETPEGFAQSLAQYGNMATLLKAKKEEADALDLRLTQVQGEVDVLRKEKLKIDAAINGLKETGIKQIKAMVAKEIAEIQAMGRDIKAEFNSRFAQYDQLVEGISQASQKLERLKHELQPYEVLIDTLKSQAMASEEVR